MGCSDNTWQLILHIRFIRNFTSPAHTSNKVGSGLELLLMDPDDIRKVSDENVKIVRYILHIILNIAIHGCILSDLLSRCPTIISSHTMLNITSHAISWFLRSVYMIKHHWNHNCVDKRLGSCSVSQKQCKKQ